MRLSIPKSIIMPLATAVMAITSFASGTALADDSPMFEIIRFDEGSKATVELVGSEAAPQASGTVKVATKAGQSTLVVSIRDLPTPQTFGPYFTSYVLWSVLPEGPKIDRLLYVPLTKAKNLEVTIPSQRFGLVVTAEPYPVVTQPSSKIAMMLSLAKNVTGIATKSSAPIEFAPVALYAPEQISTVTHGNPPLPVLGARIAVDLARRSDAETFAEPQLERAVAKLGELESAWTAKPKRESAWSALALETARLGHEARMLATERAEAARLAEEEEARRQAVYASEAEAEQARQAAEQAAREADAARLAEEATRRSVEESKARLQASLSAIMSTRREARGLVVNLSDVMFDFGKDDLRPDAREGLAKVAGVLLAYPLPAQLTIEGHTDSVGSEEFNMELSQRRAEAVRDYLMESGISGDMIVSTRGYGKSRPIASNDTDEGRSRNRRVEIIVDDDLSD